MLLIYLAGQLSLWGDEIDTIVSALRPLSGEKNFIWQLQQYNANPPGDNFIQWLLWRTPLPTWFGPSHAELFWRLSPICGYLIALFSSQRMVARWSGSELAGAFSLALFALAFGPFTYATETRFYSWAVCLMTLVAWQTMIAFKWRCLRDLVWLSVFVALGVLVHVCFVVCVYLLSIYCAWRSYESWKQNRSSPEFAVILLAGAVPYLLFKHEKHHWMFLPGYSLRDLLVVFFSAPFSAISELFSLEAGTLWNGISSVVFVSFVSLALIGRAAFAVLKRERKQFLALAFFFMMIFGEPILLWASGKANSYPISGRNILFEVPLLVACCVYLLCDLCSVLDLRADHSSRVATTWCLLAVTGAALLIHAHEELVHGSLAKVNVPLAPFSRFYAMNRAGRQLVAVGVGDQELWANLDHGEYIGGAHLWYLAPFQTHYLTVRRKPETFSGDDFLFFEPLSVAQADFPQLPWARFQCFDYPRVLHFCRTAL